MEDLRQESTTAVPYNPEKEKFLLVRRADDYSRNPGLWEFPGGILEDETPKESAFRELKEETGLAGELVRSGDPVRLELDVGPVNVYPFLVKVEGEPELSHEHSDYQWIGIDELDSFDTIEGLEKELKSLGLK
ncbi:MAG: NUDIX hydrolase [Candidatus Nanohaloarchaea archaeon]